MVPKITKTTIQQRLKESLHSLMPVRNELHFSYLLYSCNKCFLWDKVGLKQSVDAKLYGHMVLRIVHEVKARN